jgi:hypothetical protein
MAQRPGQTLANRQAIERAVQLTEQRAILRRRAVVGELFVVVVTTHTEPHLPAPAAQSPSRQACRDHREPAAQRGRVAHGAEPGQHAQEHILDEILDFAGPPEHAELVGRRADHDIRPEVPRQVAQGHRLARLLVKCAVAHGVAAVGRPHGSTDVGRGGGAQLHRAGQPSPSVAIT